MPARLQGASGRECAGASCSDILGGGGEMLSEGEHVLHVRGGGFDIELFLVIVEEGLDFGVRR